MDKEPVSPALKQTLELGPPILFFVAYLWLREKSFTVAGTAYDGFVVAAVIFVPILLVAMAALWRLTGRLSHLQVVTVVLVVVFTGLTVWFNDERFFKMKTTIVYGLFAGILGLGLLFGRSWLAWAMGDLIPMSEKGWMTLTRRLAAAFAVLAVANEIVWRTLSTDAWVTIETFVFPLALMAFLVVTILGLKDEIEDPEA
jgi:intracellular septation protein